MIITLRRSGGFAAIPALARTIVVDTERLPGVAALELEELVGLAALDRRPGVLPPPPGAADFQTYLLEVRTGDQARTIEFTDAAPDPALLHLLDRLGEYA